jgi:hypothetical protein
VIVILSRMHIPTLSLPKPFQLVSVTGSGYFGSPLICRSGGSPLIRVCHKNEQKGTKITDEQLMVFIPMRSHGHVMYGRQRSNCIRSQIETLEWSQDAFAI